MKTNKTTDLSSLEKINKLKKVNTQITNLERKLENLKRELEDLKSGDRVDSQYNMLN